MYQKYTDEHWYRWADIGPHTNYARSRGYEEDPVAVIGINGKHYWGLTLFGLNEFDEEEVKDVKLKEGEAIYRYVSDAVIAGGMIPLIKVNLDRGLAYSITDEYYEGLPDAKKFEGRGHKLSYSRVVG